MKINQIIAIIALLIIVTFGLFIFGFFNSLTPKFACTTSNYQLSSSQNELYLIDPNLNAECKITKGTKASNLYQYGLLGDLQGYLPVDAYKINAEANCTISANNFFITQADKLVECTQNSNIK